MGKLTYQTLRENVVDVIRMKIFNTSWRRE